MSQKLGVSERLLPLPVSVGRLAEIRSGSKGTISVIEAMAAYFCERNVGDRKSLEEFLTRRLDAGEGLVLLDGLDEVKAEERESVREWLGTFVAHADRNRVVVTSRRVGFRPFPLQGGAEVVVRPFGDAQVERYVRAFHRAYRRWETAVDDRVASEREADAMLEKLRSVPHLQALARNPFLLSALALIHRAEGQLPRHRVTAYMIFARALCETWSAARRIVPAEPGVSIPFEEEAIPILGELAIRMHEAYPRGVAPREFVVSTLADALAEKRGLAKAKATPVAEEFLRRAGEDVQILLERGAGEWGFLHLTFQEFFAAAGLHASERFEEVAFEHLFEKRWEEVIRLGVGYMTLVQNRPQAAATFVEKVLHYRVKGKRAWVTEVLRRQIPLATLLAVEAGEALPERLRDEVLREFVDWVSMVPANEREFSEILGPDLDQLAATNLGELLVPRFQERLDSDAVTTVTNACLALGRLWAESAVPLLVRKLKSSDSRLRHAAAEALGRIRSAEAFEPLVVALHEGNPAAASALANFGTKAALDVLTAALDRGLGKVDTTSIVEALGDIGDEAALEPLARALKSGPQNVTIAAANSIGKIGSEAGTGLLLEALSGTDWTKWFPAARALSARGTCSGTPALLEAASHDDLKIRAAAIAALGILRDERASDLFRDALRNSDPTLQFQGALAMTRVGSDQGVKYLLEHLGSTTITGRDFVAIYELGQESNEAAALRFVALLKSRWEFARVLAVKILGTVASPATIAPLLAALEDRDKTVRQFAAFELGRAGVDRAAPELLRMLRGPSLPAVGVLEALWTISQAPAAKPHPGRRRGRGGRRGAAPAQRQTVAPKRRAKRTANTPPRPRRPRRPAP